MSFHRTKDGKCIKISDMENSHLLNTMRLIRRKAEEGIVVRRGGMSICDNEPWYDVDEHWGEEALSEMEYYLYENEAKRRGILEEFIR